MNLGSVQVHRPRIPQSFVAIAQPARICLKDLRTVSADDATTLWRVNPTSAISLISPPALTVGSPFQLGQRRRRLTDAMLPCCHVAMLPCCHRLSTGTDRSHRRGGNFRFSPPDRAQPGLRSAPGGGHPPVAHRGRRPGPQQPDGGPRNPARRPGFRRQLASWRRPRRPEAALTRTGGAHARPPASRRAATISRGANNLTPRSAPTLK